MGSTFLYESHTVEITAILPSSGPTGGATPVAIIGRGFVTGAAVTFGGSSATSINVVTGSRIECVTPAHAAGDVDVVVTNIDTSTDTLSSGFTYQISVPAHDVSYRSGSEVQNRIRTENQAPRISQRLGQPSSFTFTAASKPNLEQYCQFVSFGEELFAGTIGKRAERTDGQQRLQCWDCTGVGLERTLGRAHPIVKFDNVSGSAAISALMAGWAPAFATQIEPGLDDVTLNCDGTPDLWAIISDICNKTGAKAFIASMTLYVFTVDSGFDPPDDVDEGNRDLIWPESGQAITIEYDSTQIRNRVWVRGAAGVYAVLDSASSISQYGLCEYWINDNNLTTVAQCAIRAQNELDAWSEPIPVVRYYTRDIKTRAGKTVNIDISRPEISGAWLIQSVDIDQLDLVLTSSTKPRFAVTAVPPSTAMRHASGPIGLFQTVIDLNAAAARSPKLDGDVTSDVGGATTLRPIPASKLAGCITSDQLDPTGVEAGTYGDSSHLSSFTVDAAGRITDAETDPVAVIKTDGSEPFTAPQSMGSQLLTDLATPVAGTDAATKDYVDTRLGGDIRSDGSVPFAANESMGGFNLTNVADPVSDQDAVTKHWARTHYYEPVTTRYLLGSPAPPDIVFDSSSDIVMAFVSI